MKVVVAVGRAVGLAADRVDRLRAVAVGREGHRELLVVPAGVHSDVVPIVGDRFEFDLEGRRQEGQLFVEEPRPKAEGPAKHWYDTDLELLASLRDIQNFK